MATDTERMVFELSAQMRQFEKAMITAAGSADRAARQVERRFERMNQKVTRDFDNFAGNARTALATLGLGLIGADVVRLADTWTTVGNRLAFAGIAAERLEAVQHTIANIASNTRSDLDATADLFARMYRSSEDLGASMQQVLRVTETVSKALAGASQSERQGAIRQLGQGLGAGNLAGDELRSILENSRAIAEAIATEFDTTVGNLRVLGKQGELESRRVFEAILNASELIDAQFARTTFTVADSFTRLSTEAARFVGTNERTGGSVRALTRLINFCAENFEMLADAAIITAAVVGGTFAGQAVARAITAVATLAAGMGTAAGAANGLKAAMAFLGGPLGIALSVAAAGMALLAINTDVFASKAALLQRSEDSFYSALQVITNLEVATGDAAVTQAQLAEDTNRASRELDAMASSADNASGAAADLNQASTDLIAVERERNLVTIDAAIADREATIQAERRAISLRRLGEVMGALDAVLDPQIFEMRAEANRAANAESERIIAELEPRLDYLERVRARLASGEYAPAQTAGPDNDAGGDGDGGGAARARRNALADLQHDADLRLARLLHEEARVRVLEDAEQIEKRTAAYVEAGLTLTQARVSSEAEVRAEREAMNAEARRNYEISLDQQAIDIARLSGNIALGDALSDELQIRRMTRDLVDQLAASEAEALSLATQYVATMREAQNIERDHQLANRDLENQLEQARAAGDTRAELAIMRRLELESRIAELRRLGVTDGVAVEQAEAEVAALERADMRGRFRGWFSGGLIDALNGDGDYFQNWIAEQAEAGLTEALNRVADVLFDTFEPMLRDILDGGVSGFGDAISAAMGGGINGGLNGLNEAARSAGDAISTILGGGAQAAASDLALQGAAAAASALKETTSAATKGAAASAEVTAMISVAKAASLAAAALLTLAKSGGGEANILSGIVGSIGKGAGKGFQFGGAKSGGGQINPGFIYRVHKDEYIAPAVPSFVTKAPLPGQGAAGAPMRVAVTMKNESGVQMEADTTASMSSDGRLAIDVQLTRKINSDLATGRLDETARARWNAPAPRTRRS